MSKRDRRHGIWNAGLIMLALTKTGFMEKGYWSNIRFGGMMMNFIYGHVELEPLRQ